MTTLEDHLIGERRRKDARPSADDDQLLFLLASDAELMKRYNAILLCWSELACVHHIWWCEKCAKSSKPLIEANMQFEERLDQVKKLDTSLTEA